MDGAERHNFVLFQNAKGLAQRARAPLEIASLAYRRRRRSPLTTPLALARSRPTPPATQDLEVTGTIDLEPDSFIREEPAKSKPKKYMLSVGTAKRVFMIFADTLVRRRFS